MIKGSLKEALKEALEEGKIEQVDVDSFSTEKDTVSPIDSIDLNSNPEVLYEELSKMFLNRRDSRKLKRYKKKDSFTSKLYKNIGL